MRRATDWIGPDFSFADILKTCWLARLYILACIGFLVAGAALFLFVTLPHYKITMLLGPANASQKMKQSSVMAHDNPVALSILTQNPAGEISYDFSQFSHIYNGGRVAKILLDDPLILNALKTAQTFKGKPPSESWSAEALSYYLKQRVQLEPVSGSNLYRMVYFHPDADAGRYMLQKIHHVTDTLIRDKIRAEAEAHIAYLQEALSGTQNPDHRRALTNLLLEQERMLMFVSLDQPYAASIVEPPAASLRPAWPDPGLLYLIAILVGVFGGIVLYSLRTSPQAQPGGDRRGSSTRTAPHNTKPGSDYPTTPTNPNEHNNDTERRGATSPL